LHPFPFCSVPPVYPKPIPRPRLSSALRCLALGLVAAVTCGAAAPNQYFNRRWLIDNGLPDNWVSSVTQDPRGYIWLGTMTGLVRFDGHNFREFPLPDNLRAAGEEIRALAQEDPSTLVLLSASGGILRFRNDRFVPHPIDAVLGHRELQQLFVEPDGTLWVGDTQGYIFRWKTGRISEFPNPEGLTPDMSDSSLATDVHGQTWLAEGNFLGRFENDHLVRSTLATGLFPVIAPARSGGIWIASNQRLLKWEDGCLTTLAEGSAWLPGQNLIQRLFEDHDGVLWIATRRSGLFQLSAGQIRAVTTHQQRLSGITEDSEHGVWVTSFGDGISRLQQQRFEMLRPPPGEAEIASTAVCEDRNGALWCADRSGGVVRYLGGVMLRVNNPHGEQPIYANSVSPDDSGHVWVGAISGLYRTSIDQPSALQSVEPTLKDIHVLHFSRQQDLWIGSYNRLGRLHRGVYEGITADQGYPGTFVEAVTETADGTTWVALEHALYKYQDGRLIRETAIDGFVSERLNALYGDPANALWIGSSRGLLRLQGGQMTVYTRRNGLPNERIEQLAGDDHGAIWIGSRRGFFRVARSDLEAVAAGRSAQVPAVTFGPEEGLTGQVPVPNCQPDAWKDFRNRIWFCTQQGVIGIDANAVPPLPPPPVYIDRVSVDDREVDQAKIRVATGAHRLAFYFSSPNFTAPEKVRLRHRLRGFDTDWIETGSDQKATYSDLPAGRYALEVAASDPNGIWHNAISATVSLAVIPSWWETWWARGLGAAMIVGGVGSLVRYTSHRVLKLRFQRIEQEHALEKERARIARDLHDELGGSLMQIRLLADRLKRRSEKPEMEIGLGQLVRHTRRLAGELESIIWTVNPQNNSLDRFARFVQQFAPRFFRDTAIACTVACVEEIPAIPINPEVQHHLLTVTKEALTNVLKHSEASTVDISLHFTSGVLRTEVRDNGIGFDPNAKKHTERNGLSNMRSRLGEVGGVLDIRSSTGHGTIISWRVPLPAMPHHLPFPITL